MRSFSLCFVAGLLAAAAQAQVGGHNTLPTTGPAARERYEAHPRPEDAVLDRVDRLRKELDDFGKRYKKLKDEERTAKDREIAALLEELSERVVKLKAAAGER